MFDGLLSLIKIFISPEMVASKKEQN